jgi:hypothetical protein
MSRRLGLRPHPHKLFRTGPLSSEASSRAAREGTKGGRILLGSDHMQSISGNDELVADVFVILCAPSCLGAHKMMNVLFVFKWIPGRSQR